MTDMTLKVTDCRLNLNSANDERLKAFANIVLNGCFAVNVKIINGVDGLFVAMPALPRKDGMFHDVAHPITRELRTHIENVVLNAYERELVKHGETTRTTEVNDRLPRQHGTQRQCAVVA